MEIIFSSILMSEYKSMDYVSFPTTNINQNTIGYHIQKWEKFLEYPNREQGNFVKKSKKRLRGKVMKSPYKQSLLSTGQMQIVNIWIVQRNKTNELPKLTDITDFVRKSSIWNVLISA